ncbi:MAG: tetratricopeptide repeat protein [Nitrospinae bacterium]|nr:tetratricopeptide repeat protein [Nitrospinota bacterium]
MDDYLAIIGNPFVEKIHGIKDYFKDQTPFFLSHRAFPILSFAFNYHFFGDKEYSFHAVSIIFHLLNAYLIYFLLTFLGYRYIDRDKANIRLAVFLTVLIFIVHPLHTNSVSYLSKRDVLFEAFFYLLAFYTYLHFRHGNKKKVLYGLSVLVCFILAFWSKETAITFPVVVFFYELCFIQRSKKELKTFFIVAGFIFLLLLIYVFFFYKGVGLLNYRPGGGEAVYGFSSTELWGPVENMYSQSIVLLHYWKMFLLPLPSFLNLDHGFPLHSHFSFVVGAAIIINIFLLFLAYGLYKRNYLLSAFGILWFYVALLPESSVLPIKELMVDYRTYPASLGFILILFEVIVLNVSRVKFFIGGVIFLFMLGTIERNTICDTNLTLWKDVVKKSPQSDRGHINLGIEYQKKQMNDEALQEYKAALKINPDSYAINKNLAGFYINNVNKPKEALYYLNRLKTLGLADYSDYAEMSRLYSLIGYFDDAYRSVSLLLKIAPEKPDGHYWLGMLLKSIGKTDEAIIAFKNALKIDPNHVFAKNNLKVLLKNKKK